MRISDWSSDVCSSDLSFTIFATEPRAVPFKPLPTSTRSPLVSGLEPKEAKKMPPFPCAVSGKFRLARPRPASSHISPIFRCRPSVPIFRPLIFPAYRRSEEHTSELQSLMRISYAVFCLKKKKSQYNPTRYQYKHH